MQLFEGLKEGEKLTKTKKDGAMYALASYADKLTKQPESETWQAERDWQLAELRKFGTVRAYKDKATKHTIMTTYGTVDGVTDYYGVDVNTGETIDNDKAMELYHKSKA